jgi:uncharacterized protein
VNAAGPTLRSVLIYPLKALDPLESDGARITSGGALDHDRRWAIRDKRGKFVNGKKNERVSLVRSRYRMHPFSVFLKAEGMGDEAPFLLPEESDRAAAWLTRFFGVEVALEENSAGGFPDDTAASGPTIVSLATLETVASWYTGLDAGDIRRRFRPNLVIDGVPAFWEDRLYGAKGGSRLFSVGGVLFRGINPCARCVVPTRDPVSMDVIPGFMARFIERRKATMPSWAEPSQFDHFYRLCVNTQIPPTEAGKTLRVGDPILVT